jgi:hypothetical protein
MGQQQGQSQDQPSHPQDPNQDPATRDPKRRGREDEDPRQPVNNPDPNAVDPMRPNK